MHIKSTVQNLAVIIDRSDSDFLAGLRVYSCSLRRVLNLKHVRQHTESEEIIHGHLVSVFHLFDGQKDGSVIINFNSADLVVGQSLDIQLVIHIRKYNGVVCGDNQILFIHVYVYLLKNSCNEKKMMLALITIEC